MGESRRRTLGGDLAERSGGLWQGLARLVKIAQCFHVRSTGLVVSPHRDAEKELKLSFK